MKHKHRLKNLRFRRIDLVDKGANEGALVRLFKNMDEGEPMPKDEPKATPSPTPKVEEDLAKRLKEKEEALALLEKRVADAEAEKESATDRIAKLEDAQRLTRAITQANLFKSLGNPDDLSELLAKVERQLDAETHTALKGQMEKWNTKLGEAEKFLMSETGNDGEGDTSLTSQLDKLAKAFMKDHGGDITFEQAYAEVLVKTPEGKKLYSEIAKQGGR